MRNGRDRLITQNVDGLHYRAGSLDVLELHGTLHAVRCLSCAWTVDRMGFQERLDRLNPEWGKLLRYRVGAGLRGEASIRPDGDIDLGSLDYKSFCVPKCPRCTGISWEDNFKASGNVDCNDGGQLHGILKPDVVFFGENISMDVRNSSFRRVDESEAFLVIGSTLRVFSAFRLLNRAVDNGKKAMIITLGPTRADGIDGVNKIEAPCESLLPIVMNKL